MLILDDGRVADQVRFSPEQLDDSTAPIRWLRERGPLDLVAGPSGYGLPLVSAADCGERELALMALVRPDERGRGKGVAGFSGLTRAFRDSGLPVVFLPGVVHLPSVPTWRKRNRIDLGTADKLAVTALAIERLRTEGVRLTAMRFCLVELGSAFTSCLVVAGGRVVDACAGSAGPLGYGSGGAWDGEAAYLLSPLTKADLFAGGMQSGYDAETFGESLAKAVAGLQAATAFDQILLSGRLLQYSPNLTRNVIRRLRRLGTVRRLPGLPRAWAKHAAQGAAVIADGLAGGRCEPIVKRLRLREASGTVLDYLTHPRADEVRRAFGVI